MLLQVSKYFGSSTEDVDGPSEFPGAVDALDKALLKTQAHTEVYMALTRKSHSLPLEKVHDFRQYYMYVCM